MDSDFEPRHHEPRMNVDDLPYYDNPHLKLYLKEHLGTQLSHAGFNCSTFTLEVSDTDLFISCDTVNGKKCVLLVLPYTQHRDAKSLGGVRLSTSSRSIMKLVEEQIITHTPSLARQIGKNIRSVISKAKGLMHLKSAEYLDPHSFFDVLRNDVGFSTREKKDGRSQRKLHERIKIQDTATDALPIAGFEISFHRMEYKTTILDAIRTMEKHLRNADEGNFDVILYEEMAYGGSKIWIYYQPSKSQ